MTAIDRSAAMLNVARDAAQRQGVAHIHFQTPAELFASRRRFDLVNCYHVFQRMPQGDGLTLLRELIRFIGPSGTGIFQFLYQTTTPRFVETGAAGRHAAVDGAARRERRHVDIILSLSQNAMLRFHIATTICLLTIFCLDRVQVRE